MRKVRSSRSSPYEIIFKHLNYLIYEMGDRYAGRVPGKPSQDENIAFLQETFGDISADFARACLREFNDDVTKTGPYRPLRPLFAVYSCLLVIRLICLCAVGIVATYYFPTCTVGAILDMKLPYQLQRVVDRKNYRESSSGGPQGAERKDSTAAASSSITISDGPSTSKGTDHLFLSG